MSGPLTGFKVIELAGIGPAPMCAMMLSDMGAEVVRVDRLTNSGLGISMPKKFNFLGRGRKSIAIDLKNPDGIEALLKLIDGADAVLEGFRPGVMERLGMGPDVCMARNPKLVYARVTGWGQEGPYAQMAGHDINYISLAGVLAPITRGGGTPVPPLNLVGDFGGGGMLMAFGVACALVETARSGKGQVVDCAMVDGAAVLMQMMYGMRATGFWSDERGTNLLDGGAHFYDTFETSDGKYVSIGSIEPQFYAELIEKAGLAGEELPRQHDRSQWPVLKPRFVALFKKKTRDEWCEIMEGTDICFAPVLSMAEAPLHPHNLHRETFVEREGLLQPAPAPRFSRTVPELDRPPSYPGQHTQEVLESFGFDSAEIDRLKDAKAVV